MKDVTDGTRSSGPRKQPWSTGKVGTLGASFVGYDQWLAAGLQSPAYLNLYYFTAGHLLQNLATVDWNKLYLHLPLYTMDEAGDAACSIGRTLSTIRVSPMGGIRRLINRNCRG